MKKLFLFLFLNSALINAHAQNFQIVFEAAGASSTIDSVKVKNLSSGIQLTLAATDTLQLTGLVDVNEFYTKSDNTIIIYPNPMQGSCMFDFEAKSEGPITIEIFDILGKNVLQKQMDVSKGFHKFQIVDLGNGIYTLNIKLNDYAYEGKMVSNNAVTNTPQLKYLGINTSGQESLLKYTTKSSKSIISMPFNTGDSLLVTGASGIYGTSSLFVPTQSQTYTINFVACTDGDGNNYSVVQIGTQTWMVENLKTTKYRDGSSITNVTDGTAWYALTTQAYCDYDNVPANGLLYGRLYNWKAVTDTRKIAPVGWKVPTEADITTLQDYLGGFMIAGGKLKETGFAHWESPNAGATNETGFTAIASGNRYQGQYVNLGVSGWWWTSSTGGTSWAYYFCMYSNSTKLDKFTYDKKDGFAVRCIKE